jgi:hypothetical protein
MNKLVLTCCSKKGWAAEKSSKKGENRKEKCFLSSQMVVANLCLFFLIAVAAPYNTRKTVHSWTFILWLKHHSNQILQ